MIETVVTSSVLIAAIIAIRFLTREKIGRRLRYALWGLVLLRLLLPFSLFGSSLSVMNLAGGVESGIASRVVWISGDLGDAAPEPSAPADASALSDSLPAAESGLPEDSSGIPQNTTGIYLKNLVKTVWIWGSILVALWFALVNMSFYQSLRKSRRIYPAADCILPVYVADFLPSPCLFGFFRPAVYLTPRAAASAETARHVLIHELCHFAHKDHAWSMLRGVCLVLYWFNPLVWAAAILSRTDCELACDEAAIKRLGEDSRLDYGRTLVDIISQSSASAALMCAATTMTAGKRGLKERINLIAKNPKTMVSALIVALLAVAVAAVCTFTGAKADLGAKLEAGLNDPDPLVRQAWTMIRQDIEANEYVSSEVFIYQGTNFTDAEITKLELTDSFDDLYEGEVIEAYELNYRMRPKDPKRIVLAGGMEIKDGWLLEKGSMGSPYLVAKNTGGERTYLGTIYPDGEGQGTLNATLELLDRLEAEGPAQTRVVDYPSGAAFVESVIDERGTVGITDEMRERFNLFARDYRWIYLPDMDGYESFFETTRYKDTYGYTNFADAVFYVLSYMRYPEKMSDGAMETAVKSLFAAKGRYDEMPHQAYPKFANYGDGYYSPWPEGGLDHDRMFYLLTAADVSPEEDGSVRITVRAKSYYFNGPGYEAGENERWLEEKSRELGTDDLQTAAALIAGGKMEGIEGDLGFETVIKAGGPRGLSPQFVSNHGRDTAN